MGSFGGRRNLFSLRFIKGFAIVFQNPVLARTFFEGSAFYPMTEPPKMVRINNEKVDSLFTSFTNMNIIIVLCQFLFNLSWWTNCLPLINMIINRTIPIQRTAPILPSTTTPPNNQHNKWKKKKKFCKRLKTMNK